MKEIYVTEFGALPQRENNASSFRRAMEAISGQGKVVVPPGVFYTSTFSLVSGVTLYLERGAVIKAIPQPELYEKNGFFDSFGQETTSFLIARNCENAGIDGEGSIDLSGQDFMDFSKEPEKKTCMAPRAFADSPYIPGKRITRPILFCGCRRVFVKNVTILDSPCWTVTFHDCQEALFERVTVQNCPKIPHNDGVHISACQDVAVKNCSLFCGDDCVAITCLLNYSKLCKNIQVENCLMSSRSAALRVGHLASRVQQVTAKNLRILHSNRGIAVFAGDGGQVTELTVERVDSQTHIFGGGWWGKGEPFVITNGGGNGEISHVTLKDVHAICDNDPLVIGQGMEDLNFIGCTIQKHLSAYPEETGYAECFPNGLFQKPSATENGILKGPALPLKGKQ